MPATPLVQYRISRAQFLPDLRLGFQNLLLHKLRSLLTMLGMIFGVAAVVSMLSIGAGAQQQVMAFIEQLGVRNLIVEAKESTNFQDFQRIRKLSAGLSFQDFRVIQANVTGLLESTPRKRVTPAKMNPKPVRDMPVVFGVSPNYRQIAKLRVISGRFFDEDENRRAAPVCLLGDGTKANLLSGREAVGQYIKVNEQ
jgi:putative ABC transport system permease protein